MAPDNIFNDRDYFETKFGSIEDKIIVVKVAVQDHVASHKEEKANWYKLAGMVLTAAGIVATLLTIH